MEDDIEEQEGQEILDMKSMKGERDKMGGIQRGPGS